MVLSAAGGAEHYTACLLSLDEFKEFGQQLLRFVEQGTVQVTGNQAYVLHHSIHYVDASLMRRRQRIKIPEGSPVRLASCVVSLSL